MTETTSGLSTSSPPAVRSRQTRTATWQEVCPVGWILPDSGVAARVHGHPVAIFRLSDGRLMAVDHTDPFTGAQVLGRGIVGDHGGVPTVASPLHKQRFSLLDGRCLDSEAISVGVHRARIVGDRVQVALNPTGSS